MHISDMEERQWIMREFERIADEEVPRERKLKILEELTKSETFNQFLVSKFTTTKRFGVEGLDTVISGLSISFLIKTLWLKKLLNMELNT